MRASRVVALLALLAGTPASTATPEWQLMSRQGGCQTLETAAAHKPIFRDVAGPEILAAKLRQDGIHFDLTETDIHGHRVVALSAPDIGLDILLVPRSLCQR